MQDGEIMKYFTRSVRQFQFPECKQYAVRTSVSVLYLGAYYMEASYPAKRVESA